MSTEIDVDKVRAESDPIYRDLRVRYAKLARQHGPSFATVVMLDALSGAVGVALAVFKEDARREALDVLHEEALEQADMTANEIEAFKAGYDAGVREAQA